MKRLRDEKPWVLSRMDDNGNTFEMERFETKERAEAERRIFERRGHKQAYFVERDQPKRP
jgi:hypothetical protein